MLSLPARGTRSLVDFTTMQVIAQRHEQGRDDGNTRSNLLLVPLEGPNASDMAAVYEENDALDDDTGNESAGGRTSRIGPVGVVAARVDGVDDVQLQLTFRKVRSHHTLSCSCCSLVFV